MHSGVDAQHGREHEEDDQAGGKKHQILGPNDASPPKVAAQQNRQEHHFLGVVEHPTELPVDDLLRRKIGHQEQIHRSPVTLAGKRSDRLGVDQEQTQQKQRHQGQRPPGALDRLARLDHPTQPTGRHGEQDEIHEANQQHLAPIGPGADLTPDDGVVPDVPRPGRLPGTLGRPAGNLLLDRCVALLSHCGGQIVLDSPNTFLVPC